jgi:hypothetical protein
MGEIIREMALDYKQDAALATDCKDEINDHCLHDKANDDEDGGAVEECLKDRLKEKKITNEKCIAVGVSTLLYSLFISCACSKSFECCMKTEWMYKSILCSTKPVRLTLSTIALMSTGAPADVSEPSMLHVVELRIFCHRYVLSDSRFAR